MQRVLTAAIAVPLVVLAVFRLPSLGFFILVAAVLELVGIELIRLARRWAPRAKLGVLLVLVPVLALALSPDLLGGAGAGAAGSRALALAVAVAVGLGGYVVLVRTPLDEALPALGALTFGSFYLAVPIASLHVLHRRDPWLVLLLLVIVWVGDAAAYYVGVSFGRRKLAPVLSPNKTWEGAGAGLLAALLVAAAWGFWRTGGLSWLWLALVGAAQVAGQLGDLFESLLKRGAGVKDSGALLPGHGGVLDRLDALLFAAPVFALLVRLALPAGSGGG